MGLDLALGGLVLISAIRGWMKGFLVQAIRIGGLIAAVYAASPLREQAKPYVVEYLPTIQPSLLDRLLWWSAGVVSYFVIVGVASLTVAVARRPKYGIEEPNRGDQFAGFGLGVVKGLIVTSFLVAGLTRYAAWTFEKISWAERQTKESYAWEWNQKYRPAARMWAAPPVQQFVAHVQKMGLLPPERSKSDESKEEAPPVQTASRTPTLDLSSGETAVGSDLDTQRMLEDVERQLRSLDDKSQTP
jgi:uncharacterized membrane protein required for colicin V production